MSSFVIAAIAMLVALVPAGVVIVRGTLADAVVGFEFLTSVAVLLLGSGLVFVRALERWL